MKSWRENPDGEVNQRSTYESERDIFALKMQARQDAEDAEQDEEESWCIF